MASSKHTTIANHLRCLSLPERDAERARADAAEAEVGRLREAIDIVCQWWGGCGHHPDDCPEDDAGDLTEDECKASKRVGELTKGEGR
jgi:hypothetical protein